MCLYPVHFKVASTMGFFYVKKTLLDLDVMQTQRDTEYNADQRVEIDLNQINYC